MKAITIYQPWAWALLHGKDVENRNWSTEHRGPFLIHAGRPRDPAFYRRAAAWIRRRTGLLVPDPDAVAYRGIVAKANLVDVVTDFPSPWFQGPFGWLVREVQPVRFRPCSGQRGWWTFDLRRSGDNNRPKGRRS